MEDAGEKDFPSVVSEIEPQLKLCLLEHRGIVESSIENIKELFLWRKTFSKTANVPINADERLRRKRFGFSFVASLISHITVITLMLSLAFLGNKKQPRKNSEITFYSPGKIFFPLGQKQMGGGGGGGERKPVKASQGKLPEKSLEAQIVPPAVSENKAPELPELPTIVVPPISRIEIPEMLNLGDPSSDSNYLSGGPGGPSGIGSGSGGGVGEGNGPGLGPGEGGGTGGGIYKIGNGVSAPTCLICPNPNYPDKGRRERTQGTVILELVIDENGNPQDIKVRLSINPEFDELAIKTVAGWKFGPSMKDGEAVPVYVTIEITFRLL